MNPLRVPGGAVDSPPFLRGMRLGVGKIALAVLLGDAIAPRAFRDSAAAASMESNNPLAPRPPHFAPKAKRVIHLFMAGAPASSTSSIPSRN